MHNDAHYSTIPTSRRWPRTSQRAHVAASLSPSSGTPLTHSRFACRRRARQSPSTVSLLIHGSGGVPSNLRPHAWVSLQISDPWMRAEWCSLACNNHACDIPTCLHNSQPESSTARGRRCSGRAWGAVQGRHLPAGGADVLPGVALWRLWAEQEVRWAEQAMRRVRSSRLWIEQEVRWAEQAVKGVRSSRLWIEQEVKGVRSSCLWTEQEVRVWFYFRGWLRSHLEWMTRPAAFQVAGDKLGRHAP